MKKYIYAIPSILVSMYLCFLIVLIASDFNINSGNIIFISIIFVIPFIIYVYQVIRCVLDAIKDKMYLWIILLILLGFIFMPYYGMKYEQDKIVLRNSVITYFVALISLSAIALLYSATLIGKQDKLVLTTNDEKAVFTFEKGWEEKKTDYSVYAANEDKNLAFGVLTYDLSQYEEYGIDNILEDQKNFLDRKLGVTLELYKERYEEKTDDKKIITIEYIAKSEDKNKIYQLSVINFLDNEDYVLYTFSAMLEKDYDLYNKELTTIRKNIKKK